MPLDIAQTLNSQIVHQSIATGCNQVFQWIQSKAVSIAFAPPHLGLQLAILCKEGKINFVKAKVGKFECNLCQWQSTVRLDLTKATTLNPVTFRSPELHSSVSAPRFPQKDSMTASASNPVPMSMEQGTPTSRTLKPFCMAWNASKWELPAFAVGADRNRVFIYKFYDKTPKDTDVSSIGLEPTMKRAQTVSAVEAKRRGIDWHCESTLTIPTPKGAPSFDVRAISWSAHLARKYHLIAIGCSDGFVRIIKILRNRRMLSGAHGMEPPPPLQWSVVFESNVHGDAVWNVKWTVTGNVLLSAGDDARIYRWERKRMGRGRGNGNAQYVPTCISKRESNDKHKDSVDNEDGLDDDELDEDSYDAILAMDSNQKSLPWQPTINRI